MTMRERLEQAQESMHMYSPDFSQKADDFLDVDAVELLDMLEELVGQWSYDGDISRQQYEKACKVLGAASGADVPT